MLTDPIRTEHAHLRPHVRQLRDLADGVGELSPPALRAGVGQAHSFLAGHLIPHARSEDRTLYPVVAGLMGATDATRTMSRDHVEVVLLTEQLASLLASLEAGAPDAQQAKALRRVLYGLNAIVELHFAKEEEIYLPLLDRGLSEEGARELFLAMQAPAGAEHDHAH